MVGLWKVWNSLKLYEDEQVPRELLPLKQPAQVSADKMSGSNMHLKSVFSEKL
jgi:hypothetical protein